MNSNTVARNLRRLLIHAAQRNHPHMPKSCSGCEAVQVEVLRELRALENERLHNDCGGGPR